MSNLIIILDEYSKKNISFFKSLSSNVFSDINQLGELMPDDKILFVFSYELDSNSIQKKIDDFKKSLPEINLFFLISKNTKSFFEKRKNCIYYPIKIKELIHKTRQENENPIIFENLELKKNFLKNALNNKQIKMASTCSCTDKNTSQLSQIVVVWTRIQVLSDKIEVHEQLFEWFGDLTGWNEPHIRGTVEPIFGKYEKYPMDEIGPKWILVEDMDRTDDNETYITLCSAWSFPEGYMEEFVKKMVELDEEATVKFSVDEESDDFLVGGYGSKKGFKWYEDDSPERPWEEECEEEGLDYDDEINKFYEEVEECTTFMIDSSEKEVEGV